MTRAFFKTEADKEASLSQAKKKFAAYSKGTNGVKVDHEKKRKSRIAVVMLCVFFAGILVSILQTLKGIVF